MAVACVIDEGSMLSPAIGYDDGTLKWHVLHNAQHGTTHLAAEGMLPAAHGPIRDAQLARQLAESRRVDHVFDIPVMLAHELTGFPHDRLSGNAGETPYVVLRFKGLLDDGYISWVGVGGKAPDAIHAELGVVEAGEVQSTPQAELPGVGLGSDWHVLLLNSGRAEGRLESRIIRLSRGAELVSCMAMKGGRSLAIGFAGGDSRWQVLHDPQCGQTHLEETGTLPDAYDQIRRRQLARQAAETGGVDHVFDIPVLLAHALTGYRHELSGGAGMHYAVLEIP